MPRGRGSGDLRGEPGLRFCSKCDFDKSTGRSGAGPVFAYSPASGASDVPSSLRWLFAAADEFRRDGSGITRIACCRSSISGTRLSCPVTLASFPGSVSKGAGRGQGSSSPSVLPGGTVASSGTLLSHGHSGGKGNHTVARCSGSGEHRQPWVTVRSQAARRGTARRRICTSSTGR